MDQPVKSRHPHRHAREVAVNGTVSHDCPQCAKAATKDIERGWNEPFAARVPFTDEDGTLILPDIMVGPNGPTTRVITTGHGIRSVHVVDKLVESGWKDVGSVGRNGGRKKRFCEECRVNLKRARHESWCTADSTPDVPYDGKRYTICAKCEQWATPKWDKEAEVWVDHTVVCRGEPTGAATTGHTVGMKQTRRGARLRGAIEGQRWYESPEDAARVRDASPRPGITGGTVVNGVVRPEQ